MLQDLGMILLDLLFSRKDSVAAGGDLTPQLIVSLLSLNMSPVPRHLWLTGPGVRNAKEITFFISLHHRQE